MAEVTFSSSNLISDSLLRRIELPLMFIWFSSTPGFFSLALLGLFAYYESSIGVSYWLAPGMESVARWTVEVIDRFIPSFTYCELSFLAISSTLIMFKSSRARRASLIYLEISFLSSFKDCRSKAIYRMRF